MDLMFGAVNNQMNTEFMHRIQMYLLLKLSNLFVCLSRLVASDEGSLRKSVLLS